MVHHHGGGQGNMYLGALSTAASVDTLCTGGPRCNSGTSAGTCTAAFCTSPRYNYGRLPTMPVGGRWTQAGGGKPVAVAPFVGLRMQILPVWSSLRQ